MALSITKLNAEPKEDHKRRNCPFCGAPAMVQAWHGGKATKRLISCSAGCEVSPSVTGETYSEAAAAWDARAYMDLVDLVKQFKSTVEFEIRRDLKTGDEEGARLKNVTLHLIRTALARHV